MLTYPNQTSVSVRDLAWNTAGTTFGGNENVIDAEGMTAETALREGGLLDWDVRHVPLSTALGDHAKAFNDAGLVMPAHRGVLADINGATVPLGVVGNKHTIIQNEETAELLNTIVDEGGANIVAAGALAKNHKAFVVLKMPKSILVGGEDACDWYMGAMNTHDGTGSLLVWTTQMRLACTNMLNGSMKGAASKWRLRHTSGIRGKIEEARKSLRLSYKWFDEFQIEAEKMLATPMRGDEFDRIVEQLAPPSTSDKDGWKRRAEEKRGTLRHLFHEADTNEFGRGTRWAAYNAFTEYADWYQPIRSAAPYARAERLLDGGVDGFKQDAFEALLVG